MVVGCIFIVLIPGIGTLSYMAIFHGGGGNSAPFSADTIYNSAFFVPPNACHCCVSTECEVCLILVFAYAPIVVTFEGELLHLKYESELPGCQTGGFYALLTHCSISGTSLPYPATDLAAVTVTNPQT